MMRALFIHALSALTGGPPKEPPIAWSVESPQPIRVAPGGTAYAPLLARIASGWHVYSLTQKSGGPVRMRIFLPDKGDFSLVRPIGAPAPSRLFSREFNIETEVYSGIARFRVPFTASPSALTGARKIEIAVRYQVCSETLCFPARTTRVELRVLVAGK